MDTQLQLVTPTTERKHYTLAELKKINAYLERREQEELEQRAETLREARRLAKLQRFFTEPHN